MMSYLRFQEIGNFPHTLLADFQNQFIERNGSIGGNGSIGSNEDIGRIARNGHDSNCRSIDFISIFYSLPWNF